MKKVFGFVGHGGCGKGAAGAYLTETCGAGYHRFSAILKRLNDVIFLEDNRDNLIRMSEIVRREFGEDVLARAMKLEVDADAADVVSVDGIRRMADILYLREMPHFILVHITASPEIRLARIQTRAQRADDVGKTLVQFLADEQRSTEKSIDEVVAHADVTIDNNGTLAALHAQLDALIK